MKIFTDTRSFSPSAQQHGTMQPGLMSPVSSVEEDPQDVSHQFLEEVPDSLVVAPLLDAGQKSIVELPVNLVELRHFEEDGFYLGHSEHGL